jgi:ABC-type transport system involved in multi-copper enzyme maturation permease subunit
MSLDKAVGSWFRQSFVWSNNRAAWRERLIGFLFVLIAVGFAWLSAQIDLWKAALLWAAYFVALAVCSRQGWLKLLGPVLFYDMIRTSRRSRYAIMRLVYAALLLFVLCTMFMSMDFANQVNRRDTAILAQQFFGVFMLVQLTIVILLTPAYVAGAISEEKDRKTLEFMLATDLHNREIVLSKLLSRLANITLLLLTGLPILSMLQFLGGIDGQLVLAGFAGTGLTMLGIASLSILMSTLFQKPRDSIGVTYLLIVTYVFGMMACLAMKEEFPVFMKETLWEGAMAPSLGDVAEVANAGNPLMAIIDIGMAIDGRNRLARGAPTSLAAELPGILERYAFFHVGLAILCIGWSIVRLRTIALKQTVGGSTKKLRWWERYRPPIGEMPMMWKELHIEGRTKFNWLIFGAVVVLVLLTLGSGLLVVCAFLWDHFLGGRADWPNLQEGMNMWFRIAGTGVGCLMLLMMATRAAGSITHERERDTLDALITTPMSCEAMLSAKLLGTLMSLRMGWLWYGSMMAIAILCGGIHLLAVPLVLMAWFIYAVFFTMVGMWFSMACKSSMRATVLTVLTTLFLGGGHWLFAGMCFYIPVSIMMRAGGPGDFMEYIMQFEAGLTPPWVLGLSAYSWRNLEMDFRHDKMGEMLVFCLIGLFLWALACVILWYGVLIPKFRQLTRREELVYQ